MQQREQRSSSKDVLSATQLKRYSVGAHDVLEYFLVASKLALPQMKRRVLRYQLKLENFCCSFDHLIHWEELHVSVLDHTGDEETGREEH